MSLTPQIQVRASVVRLPDFHIDNYHHFILVDDTEYQLRRGTVAVATRYASERGGAVYRGTVRLSVSRL